MGKVEQAFEVGAHSVPVGGMHPILTTQKTSRGVSPIYAVVSGSDPLDEIVNVVA